MRKYTFADVQGQIAVGKAYYDLYATYYAIMRWAAKVTQQLNRRPPQLIGRYSVNA